jgi:hypothetical protein
MATLRKQRGKAPIISTSRDDARATEEVKEFFDRWCNECPEMLLEPILWAALHQKAFKDVRLSYEIPHHVWRFSMKLPRGPRKSSREIESLMRAAFSDCGHPIAKDFIAAVIAGDRVRGAFSLLPPRTLIPRNRVTKRRNPRFA